MIHRLKGHTPVLVDGTYQCLCGLDLRATTQKTAQKSHRIHVGVLVTARLELVIVNPVSSVPVYDPTKPCLHADYGTVANHGYVRVTIPGGRLVYAHRAAYEKVYGRIPDGLVIDHICHNEDPVCEEDMNCLHRRCVEPTHLRAVTQKINALAGKSPPAKRARRAHCGRGHELFGANLYTRPDSGSGRGCRKCLSASAKRRARLRFVGHYQKYPRERNCDVCGVSYSPAASRRGISKTCSKNCHGELVRQQRTGKSKLSKPQIAEILKALEAGEHAKPVAARYSVSTATVSRIKNAERPTYVP